MLQMFFEFQNRGKMCNDSTFFELLGLFDWSKWVVGISSLSPCTCIPNFSFMSGVGKKWVTKTWMWEIFLQGHRILSWVLVEMLLLCAFISAQNHFAVPNRHNLYFSSSKICCVMCWWGCSRAHNMPGRVWTCPV